MLRQPKNTEMMFLMMEFPLHCLYLCSWLPIQCDSCSVTLFPVMQCVLHNSTGGIIRSSLACVTNFNGITLSRSSACSSALDFCCNSIWLALKDMRTFSFENLSDGSLVRRDSVTLLEKTTSHCQGFVHLNKYNNTRVVLT